MKYLRIENEGEIDAMAFLLIGASTKVGDSTKIGEFGSGANYAIAWLLRNGYDFGVYSGEKRIDFSVSKKIFRDQAFNTIVVNGKETSFTIEMGKDWKAWFILREFWSNALDEGGASLTELDIIPMPDTEYLDNGGKAGTTRIFIELKDELVEAFRNWDEYFCSLRRDHLGEFQGVRLMTGGKDLVIYRKGIQVYLKKGVPSAFHYDFDDMPINESRVLVSEFELNWRMSAFWVKAPEDFVQQFLKRVGKDSYENQIDYSWHHHLSKGWENQLIDETIAAFGEEEIYEEEIRLNLPVMLPKELADKIISRTKVEHVAGELGKNGMKDVDPSPESRSILCQAIAALAASGLRGEVAVRFTEFRTKGMKSAELNNTIYIGEEGCRSVFDCASLIFKHVVLLSPEFKSGQKEPGHHFRDLYLKNIFSEQGIEMPEAPEEINTLTESLTASAEDDKPF